MGWELIEQFVETKMDGRPCEDLIVTTGQFAAVIDGASDATGGVFDGRSAGRFAADVVASAIAGLDPDVTAIEFTHELTTQLDDAVRSAVGQLDGATRWPAACVVCISFERDEIWRVGDCNFAIDGITNLGGKRIDDAAYGFRAALNAALLGSGIVLADILADDPGAMAGRPLFDTQQHLANKPGPWGFGCINGRPVPDEYVEVSSVAGANQVVLTSDGYPSLHPTLKATEDHLQQLLAADPAGIDELWQLGKSLRPGANAMDDRAYLRLER